jgi:hypothetical protein
MRSSGEYILASSEGSDTRNIISALCAAVPAAVNQVAPFISTILTPTGDPIKDAERVCRYVRGLVTYKQDGFSEQKIQLPARLLKDTKKGDCKSYSLAVLAILTAMGYRSGFRFASYKANKIPTHVYNFVLDNQNNLHSFDACVESLRESPRFTYIKDMKVTYLAGTPTMIESREMDYIGKKGRGKKIFLSPVRGAFLSLVALNVRGLATKLKLSMAKGESSTKAFWEKLGGDFSKLKKSVSTGSGKKALFGKGKGLKSPYLYNTYLGQTEFQYGAEFISEFDEPFVGAVDWAAIGAFLATAAPALIAANNLFKKQGIPEGEGDVITEDESKNTPPLDPDKQGFEAADPETKTTPSMIPGFSTGFKPSPLLIGGLAAGALALYFITKKKK